MSNTDGENLKVTVTSDTASGVSGAQAMEDRLASLEQAFVRVSGATKAAGVAHGEHAKAATGLAAGLKDLADHSITAARGFEVLGLEANAGASKLAGLAEVLEQIEHAAPGLIIAGAALAALSVAAVGLAEGIKAAGEFEGQMTSLGTAVKIAGGDWATTSEEVKKFIEVQEKATGFDAQTLVASMNKLVTAGASVRDSQVEIMIAEDAARAKHMQLSEVVGLITEAEAGRATGLVRMDEKLKPLIESHQKLSVILLQLSKDMEGQAAAAADTYEGKVDKLHATWDTYVRGIGSSVLPSITNLVTALQGLGNSIGDVLGGVADLSIGIVEAVETAAHKAANSVAWLRDQNTVHNKLAGPEARSLAQIDLNRIATDNTSFDSAGADIRQGFSRMFKQRDNPWQVGHKMDNDAAWEAKHQRDAAIKHMVENGLDNDPRMGKVPKGGQGSSMSFTDSLRQGSSYDGIGGDQQQLTEQIAGMNNSESVLKANISGATTELQKQALTVVYDSQVTADLAEKKRLLTDAMSKEVVLNTSLNDQLKLANTAANEATYQYDQAGKKMNALGDNSLTAQNHLAALKTTMDNANGSVSDLSKKIDDNKKNFNANSQALAENTIASITNANAAKALELQWDAFYTKLNAEANDDRNTAEMTNAQKVVYFTNAVAQIDKADAVHAARRMQLVQDEKQAELAADKDVAEAYKKWVDDAVNQTASFADKIILQHQSLRDTLKSITDSIAKNWIDTFAKMAIGGGTGPLAGLFPGNPLASGGAGAGNSPTYTAGSLNVHVTDAGTNFAQKMTGNTTGVGSNSVTQQMNTLSAGATATRTTLGDVSAGFGAIAGGTAIGSGIGNLISGGNSNSGNAAIGGVIGGIGGAVGLALTGGLIAASGGALAPLAPLIMAGSAAVGSAIGGLFGPHETALQTPDSSDPTYGQDLANWDGGANNTPLGVFNPTAKYNPGTGATSQSAQIASYIDTVNLASLTDAQKQLVQQLQTLNGGTSGNNLGVTSEHQGILKFQSGQSMSVTDWEGMIDNFQTLIGGGANAGAPIYNIARSYPDFNAGVLNATGASTPPGGGTSTNVNGTTVIINNPTIVGPAGLNDTAVAIGQAINRSANGTIVGSPNNWRGIGTSLRAATQGLA